MRVLSPLTCNRGHKRVLECLDEDGQRASSVSVEAVPRQGHDTAINASQQQPSERKPGRPQKDQATANQNEKQNPNPPFKKKLVVKDLDQ